LSKLVFSVACLAYMQLHDHKLNIQLKGSVKEPNILIYFFFRPSLNRVLFPMFCLLMKGECQMLVF